MATLKQLAASLSDSEKGLYSESPYPYLNRDQELAGITRDMKQLAVDHQMLLIMGSSISIDHHSLLWDSLPLSMICSFVKHSIA